jgi:hypothetical protein
MLGPFGTRINVAYLLYAIDKPTRDAMSGLAKVRNAFAHNLDINFRSSHAELKKGMARLRLHEIHERYPHPLWEGTDKPINKPTTPRAVFITNMRIMMALLMRDLNAHEPYSTVPVVLAKQLPSSYRRARPSPPQK